MTEDAGIATILAERPDLEPAVESLLAVDEEHDTWTFDDVPLDSGRFGEIVASGAVERVDGEYRLADPAATRAVLEGDVAAVDGTAGEATADSPGGVGSFPSLTEALSGLASPTVDRTTTALVALALALVAAVRLASWTSVFRDGRVVLSGNDAYNYRHYVDLLLTADGLPRGPGLLTQLPSGVETGEPLYIVTMWAIAAALGEGASAAGVVMATYPVVSAVVTAALTYLLAVRVTKDRRVGLAAVLFLAIVPGHAVRTSLGFADHHAFDYPWLVATALCIVLLATTDEEDLRSGGSWLIAGALGLLVSGQVLAWNASPLILVPIGLSVVAVTALDVRAGRSPLTAQAPIAAGLVLATAITAVVHLVLGWQEPTVAFAPALVLAGALGATAVAAAVARATGDVRHVLAIDGAGAVVGVLALRVAAPGAWDRLAERVGSLVADRQIAETMGLFDPASVGFLLLFGFTLVLALPLMAWAVRRSLDDRRWAVPAVYAWFFLLLATFQVRFVGELAPFAAVFAGVGFVWVVAWVDAARPITAAAGEPLQVPDRRTLGTVFVLFLLFGSLGAVQVPIKTNQVTIEDGTYHSATYIADRADRLGQTSPESYVLSHWNRNRVYNYFVSGNASSYGFARNHYGNLTVGTDPDAYYPRIADRAGYVVVDRDMAGSLSERGGGWIAQDYGSRTDEHPGLGHYRALYEPPGGDRLVAAVVPGATIRGTATPNATASLSTNASIENGPAFTYERRATAAENGTFAVTVAQPGEYRVAIGDEVSPVTVTATAVREGETVSV